MNRQKNAYLAVGYACNQKCRCCPISNNQTATTLIAPFHRLKAEAEQILSLGVTDVTISGGEPTIHPDFFEIINLFVKNDIVVHILSNGERFSESSFFDRFKQIAHKENICITTTFHSHIPQEHEFQNQTGGSFMRSFVGLKALDALGINIAVKHCITANNYIALPEFIKWALENFSANAEIQLWGIDLCGISEALSREVFVDYQKITPYIERAIDIFEEYSPRGSRVLTVNNLPLCMCDAYYWGYFTPPEADNYIEHLQNGRKMDAISGPVSSHCASCRFQRHCPGVYYSNFDVFGDDIVAPPARELAVLSVNPRIISYNKQRIGLTYLSPLVKLDLSPLGFRMWNERIGDCVTLRIRSVQMDALMGLLRHGVSDEELTHTIDCFELDGAEVVKELMLKGIIE